MQEFKKRPASHVLLRFFAMSAGTVALFFLSVVVVRAAWNMYGTFQIAVDARDNAEGQLASLKSDQARLAAADANFDSPSGVEGEMRERFGVVKPGEGEIQIVRDQASSSIQTATSENIVTKIFRSLFVW